jgi:hypothetical protein
VSAQISGPVAVSWINGLSGLSNRWGMEVSISLTYPRRNRLLTFIHSKTIVLL